MMESDELVDVVDRLDRVVASRPRRELVAENYRVVHVLAFDARGRLLLQRPAQALGKAFRFGSSVAGHVRAGESYAAAAAREYHEELGLRPRELRDLGKTWQDGGGGRKFIGVFIAHEDRALRPDPREVLAVEAYEVYEVRRLLIDAPETFSETFARVFHHADASGHVR